MIIGKSLTALGGGGLKPEIRVTARAGALLNLYFKGSNIILQSYQLGESETTHTFVVSVSDTAYVVEDMTNEASVEVLVDAVAVFEAEIKYIPYLYKDGVLYEDFTGGYDETKYNYSSSYTCTSLWTKNADTLSANFPSYPHCVVQSFNNSFDIGLYSKICVECTYNGVTNTVSRDISAITGSMYVLLIYLNNSISKGWSDAVIASQKSNYSTVTSYGLSLGSGITGTMYVNKIWFE